MYYVNNDYKKPINVPAGNFVLDADDWNDFGYHTQFRLYYFDENGRNYIGKLRILQGENTKTVLPSRFEKLTNEYISLGRDLDYYKTITRECPGASNTLIDLRDIAWDSSCVNDFEANSGYLNSIIRDNSALRAKRFGKAVVLGEKYTEDFNFTYLGQIPGASTPTESTFKFSDDDDLPGRIIGIIGKNAVGKTQFLASLARDLVQIKKTTKDQEDRKNNKFNGKRPIFTIVITVSYSAFDRFDRPKDGGITSYKYCGIRSQKNDLSKKDMEERFKENVKRIIKLGRADVFKLFMDEIFEEVNDFILEAKEDSDLSILDDYLRALSSGQSIYAHFVASIIAWIQEKSLIIFDEPETHLHPNAVANLFNSFSRILEKYDSYGIVATHSPVVLQEIPSKYAMCFIREGSITRAVDLGMESFGESISNLTRHIFETIEIPNLYKKHLKRLALENSYEDNLELFNGNLSLSAKSFLLSQYNKQ